MTQSALLAHLRSWSCRILAAGLLAVAAGLPAQDPTQPPQQPGTNLRVEQEGGEDILVFSINEQDGLPLKEFIKMAQKVTTKLFTYSEQELTQVPDQKVTFLGVSRIKKRNFFGFFQTMLYIKGFACVPRGEADTEVFEIIYMNGPKRGELTASVRYVTPDELENYRNQTGVTVLTSIPVEHINPTAATNSLRPFFIGSGAQTGGALTFGNVGNAKAVLIQGFGPQVYAAYQILKLVDVPVDQILLETRVVRLEHQAAEELEPILNEILADRSRQRTQPTDPNTGQAGLGQAAQLKILAHTTQNALLISGMTEQIVEALDLVARLDVPVEITGGDQHVVVLKNTLAEDMRATLNDFIQADLTAEQQAQQGAQQAAGARRPRRTVVIAHKESNSLLISGTASKYQQLKKTIDQLDRRQPQVLIECAIVELTTDVAEQLGVELGFIDIKESGDYTRGFGFTSFGLTTFQDTDDDGLPDTRLPDFENPLQGLTGGIIQSDDFAIPFIINALQTNNQANVLSVPSVVVNNNQNAAVRAKEIRPTQTVTQNTTGSQQGAGEDKEAGIDLSISPSISTNNYLRLNIKLQVSRFTTQFDPSSVTAGVQTTREVETQVTMPSGHTMVLGGVILDVESEGESGIPILKDIPILGFLFRSSSSSNSKTNLYFFLTPHILNEEDFTDLAEISFRKKLEAAEYIGHRRLQIVDRKWREQTPETLEDPGATLEDFDQKGGFSIPVYTRPGNTTGPTNPGEIK